MITRLGARAASVAAVSTLSLVGFTAGASAEEAPLLSLSDASVLTLPAGDDVRDTSLVTLTSDAATTVTPTVRAVGSDTAVLTLDPIVIVDPAAPATIAVPVAGLTAGEYELVATPATGEAVTTPVTVGSGEPTDVSLSLSNTTILSWTKATPTLTTATVSATDETGLKVPFSGKVRATVGSKSVDVPIAATGATSATARIKASALTAGTGSVKATVAGTSGTTYSSAPATLRVVKTAVTKVAIGRSTSLVYPAKDGYHDSVKLTVTPSTTRSVAFSATGSVKITYKGKTVKTWTLTNSRTWSGTWDGKYQGKVVPGTYTATVYLRGPEGTTQSAKTTITVKSGKLVTATKTVRQSAKSVLTAYEPYDEYEAGFCAYSYNTANDVFCAGFEAYYVEGISLIAAGRITVPSDVLSSQKYGGASVKVTADWDYLYGDVAWCYDTEELGCTRGGAARSGKQNLGSLKLPATSKKVHVTLGLGEQSAADVATFTSVYTYKKMVS